MVFSSLPFIFIFMPIVLAGYFFLSRLNPAWSKLWLFFVSIAFVMSNRPSDALLLLGSAVANFFLSRMLLRPAPAPVSRRALMILGVGANIAFLCYFKYAAFFVSALNQLAHRSWTVPHSMFPLGISFYTICQIMFIVDCYEGLIEQHTFVDHIAFATLFPYVSMGPIVRWKQVVPQLNNARGKSPDYDNLATGLFVFVIGLFKKVVLADTFFRWADAGFAYHNHLSLVGGWIAALAFTFELYFDFSGYTDMAIGAALMLNISLPQNFNAPFHAQSIIDFWRRWHITLTNFITTYLYTPMIRFAKRVTFGRALLATFLAMVIAGLWHGANWTFIVFGALHGLALVLNQVSRKLKWSIPGPVAWLLTFTFVTVSLVFFRSASVVQGLDIVKSMFSLQGGLLDYQPWSGIDRMDQLLGGLWMLSGVVVLVRAPSSMQWQRTFKPSWVLAAVTVALAVIACIYANGVVSRSFVYHEF